MMLPCKPAALLLVLLSAVLLSSCGGPRTKWFVKPHPAPLAADAEVKVYVGKIDPPYQQIAIIDTGVSKYETDEVRLAQLEELRKRAREVGANAVQDVRILSQRVKGITPDERTPFKSWQQGHYPLYFMRGMAIRIADQATTQTQTPATPKTLSDVEPAEGWAVQNLPVPPPLPAQSGTD